MQVGHGSDQNLDREIQQELTEILYRNLVIGLLSLMLMSGVIVWQLFGNVNDHYLMIWYAVLNLNLLLGLVLTAWYKHTKNNIHLHYLHYYLYIFGSSLTALFWGIIASVLMPTDIQHQTIVMIIVLCVVGAAIQSLHASYLASINYLILSLMPLLTWQVMQILDGKEIYIGMFIATLTYSFYLAIDVYSGNATLIKNIKLKIENIDYATKLRQHNMMMETLSIIVYYLQRATSEKEILNIFSQYIKVLFPQFSGSLSIMQKSRKFLKNVIVWGKPQMEINQRFLATDCLAVCSRQPSISQFSYEHIGCQHLKDTWYGCWCIPLMTGNRLLGVISIFFDNVEPNVEEREIMNRLAGDMALSLANVRMHKNLKDLSIQDSLTRLYNRRHLENIMNELSVKAESDNSRFAIIMFDIDLFKQINDTYGHDAGDIILRDLAKLMKLFFRETNYCFRYGGDEFIVIVSGEQDNARQRAEKFREAVKNIHFKEYPMIKISISGGIIIFPSQARTVEECFIGVDKALYKAKKEGRDNICTA